MLFLINLDSAVERRACMSGQLERLGIGFERVGVDLRCVRPADIDARIQEIVPGVRFDRQALSGAEIGCWLSHLSAWRRLLARGEACCTVIEDDLQLREGFGGAIADLDPPRGFDLVYLGTSSRNISRRRRSPLGEQLVYEPIGVIFNTWGYVITREYAARFFEAGPRRIGLPIDHFLGGRARRARPRIGVVQPAVVAEDPVLGAHSQIGPYTRRLDRARFFQAARRRLLASPVSALYYALYRYL
jgi:glycosyl transferase, family 25